ncbi:hypothetical protein BASA50_011383 [Batrachochytrium salamandrivorans]|uniref:Kinesin-like protein n=1 Tax=Batrachochytrium salamandrivorans TaxID=1357716 RepID=A0ABQ8EWD0_9FUNG|nr:hypothetical protein BASA62_006669 [Batrachochytrium salamandrivorans]KAH6587441.1 hypothetical protein BASA50_011383 [Batrachochytrium salamandrivorans]KAH6602197.1 hypothetical protein BASA61_001357 [Batrachochytrium salamandrivorans]KAH9272384.1 hypothetical protein BASA83_005477 [Batrachochytrium salamandrivorans]
MKTTQLPAVRFRSNQSASSGLHPTTTSQGGGSGAPTSFGLYTPVQSPSSSASSSSLLGSMVRSDSISSSISGTSSVSRKSSKRGHMCHVAVRIRPPSADELNQKGIWVVDEQNSRISLSEDYAIETGRRRLDEFHYDSVFQGSDNHYMYDTAVKRAIASAMDGIDATVFAYGQTSSGKTYSMMGYEEQPGIIPQAVDDVFTFISTQSGDKEYLLRVSYMEIYNETIRDLLNPEQTNLCIHEHRTKGVYVSPLKEEIVTSPKQLMKVIARGESNRSVGATNFNSHSSRSHTIFTLTIESRKRSDSASRVTSPVPGEKFRKKDDKCVTLSHLSLIDLAGSEKATDDLERRKEGAYINKSLLALGNVICRITEETSGHIPYRDSKLTRILQSSLSGHSRISVIATLSPAAKNLEESLNTLKFASRVKRIVPKPEYTLILDDKALIQKYRREIEDLKHKLSETNSELEHERERLASSTSDSSPGLNDTERQHYEEQLHESRLVRTALKERIDHLTKLILTSSTISAKPLLDWSIAANDMDGKRSSVMLSAGLIPPADPVARASMMFDPRAGRSSRVPMSMAHAATKASSAREAAGSPRLLNRQLTDRVFIQKHIEEIDRRDVRISMLEGCIASIKTSTKDMDTRSKVSAFEKTHSMLFPGEFCRFDAGAGIGAGNPVYGGMVATADAAVLTRQYQELEIVVQEYRHKIEMLENKLEESNALVRFGEADHNEVSKVVEEQYEFIETLKERNMTLERQLKQFQESTRKQPRLSRESLGSLLDLVKRETASMNKDQLRETGWEHRISEVAAALEHERAAGESSKATANQFADLEAELYSIQSRLRS